MRVALRQQQGGWGITSLDGPFAGRQVAHAEGVVLRQATFQGSAILGQVQAVWGAVIEGFAHSCVGTVRGLGINRAFDPRPDVPAIWNGEAFVHYDTNQVLGGVAVLVAMPNRVSFWEKT